MGSAIASAVPYVGSATYRQVTSGRGYQNTMPSPEGKNRNLRTALVLTAIALAVFVGFIARSWYLNH